jgi:hypothetical protein
MLARLEAKRRLAGSERPWEAHGTVVEDALGGYRAECLLPTIAAYVEELHNAFPTLAAVVRQLESLAESRYQLNESMMARITALEAERPRLVECAQLLLVRKMAAAYEQDEPEDGYHGSTVTTLAEVEAELAREAPEA